MDSRGREVLSYIPGTAVVEPYPDWALTYEALISVAELLRAYHEAASTFDSSPHFWAPSLPEEFVGDVVTHNDINLDNVVFRDGQAVALIDFDLASPGSRPWDVACAARLWAPLRPDIHISDTRRGRQFERFRLFVDTYGMNDSDRLKVAAAVQLNYIWFYNLIKTNAASGHAGFAKLWTLKTMPRDELARRWHSQNMPNLLAALGLESVPVAHARHGMMRAAIVSTTGQALRPAMEGRAQRVRHAARTVPGMTGASSRMRTSSGLNPGSTDPPASSERVLTVVELLHEDEQ